MGISPEYKSAALTNNTAVFPLLNRRNIHNLQRSFCIILDYNQSVPSIISSKKFKYLYAYRKYLFYIK